MHYFIGDINNSYDLKRIQIEFANLIYIVGDTSSLLLSAHNSINKFSQYEDNIFLSCISIQNYLKQYYSLNNNASAGKQFISISAFHDKPLVISILLK